MDKLETNYLNSFKIEKLLYARYMDDILIIAYSDVLDLLFSTFNNFHPKLQFTIELETNRSINFLDMPIIKIGDKIITNWCQKNTLTDKAIDFFSDHPKHQKI